MIVESRGALPWCVLAAVLPAAMCGCVGPPPPGVDSTRACIDAKTALLQAAEDQSPQTRANAMEALAQTVAGRSGRLFVQALGDESPAVRFAAAMAVGDVGHAPAKAPLLKMAADKNVEPDRRVLCAVICALHSLGDDTHAGELGKLLFDREAEVRANAALVMGKMGEPSAIGPLKTLLGDEQNTMVELQVVESLALLGDPACTMRLEAYSKRPFLDERLVAISALARVRSQRAVPVLRELLGQRNPLRVRVAAAGALGRLGQFEQEGFDLCMRAARDPQAVLAPPGTRGAGKNVPAEASALAHEAAISLGWMRNQQAVSVLHPLLSSPDGSVRVAAAMSILRLFSAQEAR